MFARAVTICFQPGKIAEATSLVSDVIVPVLREQPGFKGQLLLSDTSTGKSMSINFWETEAELSAFETSTKYRELMSRIGPLLTGPPEGQQYVVGVNEMV